MRITESSLKKIKAYFIGHRLQATDDVFDRAKINLVFDFSLFLTLLAIPFMIQLFLGGFWYHFFLNVFELVSLLSIMILFRSNIPLRYIGILFVMMDAIMSFGSLAFQNGHFEIQAGFWSMLLIMYTFFVLGKTWGLATTLFVSLLYLGCVPFGEGKSILNFGIPENQILPTASGFIVFPFVLNIYIIIVFLNTRHSAEKLIRKQKKKIETQNNEIVSSIVYARRIQQAKLPDLNILQSILPDSFVLFKPKDIVSGDFYFFHRSGQKIFIAAADCTGHGVPGAIMSMICSEKLEEAVTQTQELSEILRHVNRRVKASLHQSDDEDSTRDGMDIALCVVDPEKNTLQFAGANRPLWIIRQNSDNVEEQKGDKKAIGGLTGENYSFATSTHQLRKGDSFYLFTDGYADTFGGAGQKKIKVKRLREIILSASHLSMKEQESRLERFVEDWKAGAEQTDDILVMGIRL